VQGVASSDVLIRRVAEVHFFVVVIVERDQIDLVAQHAYYRGSEWAKRE
jgi:hypothetical protein